MGAWGVCGTRSLGGCARRSARGRALKHPPISQHPNNNPPPPELLAAALHLRRQRALCGALRGPAAGGEDLSFWGRRRVTGGVLEVAWGCVGWVWGEAGERCLHAVAWVWRGRVAVTLPGVVWKGGVDSPARTAPGAAWQAGNSSRRPDPPTPRHPPDLHCQVQPQLGAALRQPRPEVGQGVPGLDLEGGRGVVVVGAGWGAAAAAVAMGSPDAWGPNIRSPQTGPQHTSPQAQAQTPTPPHPNPSRPRITPPSPPSKRTHAPPEQNRTCWCVCL